MRYSVILYIFELRIAQIKKFFFRSSKRALGAEQSNPKVEGNLGAKNEPLGQELSDHWVFGEEDDLFLVVSCYEWM